MTRVAVISANLGAYDPPHEWTPQVVPAGVSVSVHRFDDSNFPLRSKAMTPALQVGLLKWFGPEFVPAADVYLWVDASCALLREDSVAWFLDHLERPRVAVSHVPGRYGPFEWTSNFHELVLFKHPDRSSILAEYEFMKARMERPGEKYLTRRYQGEWLDALYTQIASDPDFVDDRLYASTALMYRPTERTLAMMKDVWFGKTRWHLHDQLYLAYAVQKFGCATVMIDEKYTECAHLTYVRNRKRAA